MITEKLSYGFRSGPRSPYVLTAAAVSFRNVPTVAWYVEIWVPGGILSDLFQYFAIKVMVSKLTIL